jgi:hypothetical protein
MRSTDCPDSVRVTDHSLGVCRGGGGRHCSVQLVLPRPVRPRCLGCQECQSKSKTGHSSSAPACDLYAFLVKVQSMNVSTIVTVLLLGFLALYRFHPPKVEALA